MNDNTNSPASPDTPDSDAVNCSTARVYFGPVQSPEKRLIASDIERIRAVLDSPLHPLSLSTLPVLPSPQDAPDEADERSDEDAYEISNVAAHLSREDTPENDPLSQNEPSSVLASRIMRASDNPSPPPRPHPTVSFGLVMNNGRTPFPDISPPPSPFRPINLRERLDQFAAEERALSPKPPLQVSSDQHEPLQDSGSNISQPDLISFESCSALVKMLPTGPFTESHSRGSPVQNLSSGATTNIDDLLSQSPHCPPVVPSSPPRVDGVELSHSSDSLDELRQGVAVDIDSEPPHPSSSSPLIANPSAPDDIKERTKSPVRRSTRLSMTPRPLQNTHAQPSESRLKGKSRAATLLPQEENSTMPNEHTVDHGNADPFPHIERSPEEKERRLRRRGLNGKLETPNLKRELGSLSPQSAEVLARLLPTEGSRLLPEGQSSQPLPELSFRSLDPPPSTPQRPNLRHPNFSLTALQRPLFVAPTPIRPIGALSGPSSPLKFSVTADDASRTPARRVPIQDAFVQGSASAQNAMLLSAKRDASTRLTMRGPVFSRPALDDVSRSPAKRVLISELNSPVRSPTRPAASRARSTSMEPKPLFPQPVRSRSVDPSPQASLFADSKGKEPMFPKISSKPRSGAKLPFPLVAGQKAGTDLPHSIPEEVEGPEAIGEDSIANEFAALSSPAKSSLKKPSTGSRIPRIGAKPYARPQPKKPVSSAVTKLPAFGAGSRAPPFKLAAAGSSSSDESHAVALPSIRKLEGNSGAEPSVLSTLKRKRGAEETAKSPPVTHTVMVRQVVPGMLGGKYAPKAAPELSAPAPPPEPSPRKPPGPMKFRKVEPGVISARYADLSKPTETDSSPADDNNRIRQLPVQPEAPSTQPPSPPPILPGLLEGEPLKPSHDVVELQETADASSSHPSIENRSQGRRMSRRKAVAQHANDVFDTSTSTQPLKLRRSRRSEGDGFLGMSAVALQALTNSNTTKNQQVFAKLEREIIRKEGVRPESPTVKVRTILQKQREARDQQRHERAERRARRSEDGPGLSDAEDVSELGDQSMISNREHDENEGVVSAKHRRGAGEVEDYETPEKSDRSIKRLRFGDDIQEEARERKRVKWHRGLSTEIYLDQVQPRPNSRNKDVIVEKSCLAPTSKSLRLDTLGNLVDTEQHPLTDFDPENIVVKKYVYDNDIEVEKEVIPPKITRSKSKKMKS
ncbi:hypothetical protein K503DRAFT_764836 [Rhizopogon vinicolor AM-OR11-026]|uniref:Uncharacterized protein n=1 Tax=Rhizopogon vinicolor AM-OR11-026 TaxID=1314800 RepID=A0A1B7NIG1_9AGAM|nr:hypothetical protein K503DRAFT_764836 [Rhizopogon vinicolor AM-OR11-026]